MFSVVLIVVVYLLSPTSNHNLAWMYADKVMVVYLLSPTSNHNFVPVDDVFPKLYIF